MKRVLKYLLIFILLSLLAPVSFGAKLEEIKWLSDFHLGLVTGIGTGMDFGITAMFLPGNLKFGAEVEQLITDVDYTATINGTKVGAVLSFNLTDSWVLSGHLGSVQFKSNKDIVYNDSSNKAQIISADLLYRAQYRSIALNYKYKDWGLIITPKYTVNTIGSQGSIGQFDINIGKTF